MCSFSGRAANSVLNHAWCDCHGYRVLILFEPYRFQRLISFTDPWADPLGVGYQLSNALMAFGRGEWFGTGLGHSVQNYLIYLKRILTLCWQC